MPPTDLTTVLTRMATDPSFAAAVKANPSQALAPFSLSDDEIRQVAGTSSEEAGGDRALGERQSKSSLFFGNAGHGFSSPSAPAWGHHPDPVHTAPGSAHPTAPVAGAQHVAPGQHVAPVQHVGAPQHAAPALHTAPAPHGAPAHADLLHGNGAPHAPAPDLSAFHGADHLPAVVAGHQVFQVDSRSAVIDLDGNGHLAPSGSFLDTHTGDVYDSQGHHLGQANAIYDNQGHSIRTTHGGWVADDNPVGRYTFGPDGTIHDPSTGTTIHAAVSADGKPAVFTLPAHAAPAPTHTPTVVPAPVTPHPAPVAPHPVYHTTTVSGHQVNAPAGHPGAYHVLDSGAASPASPAEIAGADQLPPSSAGHTFVQLNWETVVQMGDGTTLTSGGSMLDTHTGEVYDYHGHLLGQANAIYDNHGHSIQTSHGGWIADSNAAVKYTFDSQGNLHDPSTGTTLHLAATASHGEPAVFTAHAGQAYDRDGHPIPPTALTGVAQMALNLSPNDVLGHTMIVTSPSGITVTYTDGAGTHTAPAGSLYDANTGVVWSADGHTPLGGAVQLAHGSTIIGAGSGNIIGAGSGNIIGAGSGNIIGAGSGNIIGAGSGNIIGAGSGNIIGAGAGNIVGAGSGNIIGAGAGNIIGAGAGNLTILPDGSLSDHAGHIIGAGAGNVIHVSDATLGAGSYNLAAQGSYTISSAAQSQLASGALNNVLGSSLAGEMQHQLSLGNLSAVQLTHPSVSLVGVGDGHLINDGGAFFGGSPKPV